MKTVIPLRIAAIRSVRILILIAAVILFTAGHLSARTLICQNNPDYFSKRCTLHPYAVTRVVDGQVVKGHLVGCQFKSYTCMDGVCRDNYGPLEIPYAISMDDHQGFCRQLCNNPPCSDPLGWQ
ncbi:hypothetical protein OOT00_05285 [Desulfobotulus sp. H1]|uniref:Single domain-containing protein n=1 Tax=Desulfobotulus pelophilus TaxID=2823377 RepID=A0ABT3N7G9_9BACT|nr:hypothetical protein [Desulfobotulus pelophilus]MCW7753398.1 hypothetical protein [Desulfobotulus pelophilus]